MKIALKDVLPNPYRNLDHYPIDKAKIAKLKTSFERTGFWDNLVGRRMNGKVEIAYGHHRLRALRETYPSNHQIDMIERELDNGTMVKVMADENDEVYNMTPAVINETVKAARDLLRRWQMLETKLRAKVKLTEEEMEEMAAPTALEFVKALSKKESPDRYGDAPRIAKFLDWDVLRVEEALAELAEIENPKLSEPERQVKREIIEKMPSQKAAREFRRKAAKFKTPIHAQKKVAQAVHSGEIGTKDIGKRLVDAEFDKMERRRKRFEDVLEDIRKKMVSLTTNLGDLEEFKRDLEGDVYRETIEVQQLQLAVFNLVNTIHSVFGKVKADGKSGTTYARQLGR